MGNNNQNNNNYNATTNKNGNSVKEEKLSITVTQPIEFEPELTIKTFKSQQLADKIVNPIFKATFKDYKGCIFNVEQNGKVTVDLFFVKNTTSNAPFSALEEIGAKSTGSDTLSRIQRVNQMSSRNRVYQLTTEAQEMLSEISAVKDRNGKVNWKQMYVEIEGTTELGIRQATGKVLKLDLNLILRKGFGYRDKEGSKTFYNVTPLRKLVSPYMIPGAPATNDYIFRVECLNENATEDTLRMLGNGAVSNGIPMYTAEV